jgi:hypothetical protein
VAYLGGLNRIFQRQAKQPRRPLRTLNAEQGSHILVRLKMCGAPSKRPELSSSRKTVEDPAFVFGSRSKRNKLMNWTEPLALRPKERRLSYQPRSKATLSLWTILAATRTKPCEHRNIARPEPHRAGLCQAQASAAQSLRPIRRRSLDCNRSVALSLHPNAMRQLLRKRRIMPHLKFIPL